MGRPHIEFLQSKSLEWEPEPLLPGAWKRTLSRDPETGACTQMAKMEPGLHFEKGSRIAADEEFYVLSGCYYLNGYEYAAGCYGYYPAGHPRAAARVRRGGPPRHGHDHRLHARAAHQRGRPTGQDGRCSAAAADE